MEVKVKEHCLEVSRERGKKPLFRGGSVHPGALLPAPIVLCIAFFFCLYCTATCHCLYPVSLILVAAMSPVCALPKNLSNGFVYRSFSILLCTY